MYKNKNNQNRLGQLPKGMCTRNPRPIRAKKTQWNVYYLIWEKIVVNQVKLELGVEI